MVEEEAAADMAVVAVSEVILLAAAEALLLLVMAIGYARGNVIDTSNLIDEGIVANKLNVAAAVSTILLEIEPNVSSAKLHDLHQLCNPLVEVTEEVTEAEESMATTNTLAVEVDTLAVAAIVEIVMTVVAEEDLIDVIEMILAATLEADAIMNTVVMNAENEETDLTRKTKNHYACNIFFHQPVLKQKPDR